MRPHSGRARAEAIVFDCCWEALPALAALAMLLLMVLALWLLLFLLLSLCFSMACNAWSSPADRASRSTKARCCYCRERLLDIGKHRASTPHSKKHVPASVFGNESIEESLCKI